MAMKMSEIVLLTDDQLYEKLLLLNQNIGPVVGSTRAVYETLLFDSLNEEEEKTVLAGIGIVQDTIEKPIMKTDPSGIKKSRRSTSKAPIDPPLSFESSSQSNSSPHIFKRWDDADDSFGNPFDDISSDVSFRSRTSLSPRSPIRRKDLPFPPRTKKGGSLLKIVVLVLFVLALAILVLLIMGSSDPYKNIEAEVSKISERHDSEAAA